MRTSHIPACQRANEDTYCGGWWDRGNGTLPWPSALWEFFFFFGKDDFHFFCFISGKAVFTFYGHYTAKTDAFDS